MLHGQGPGAPPPPPAPPMPGGGVGLRHPQLERFGAEMSRLGSHPDKDTILRATTIAKQHSQDLAKEIVELLRARVLSSQTPPEHRLPLCYLMDSLLQNARAPYPSHFARCVVPMLCRTYEFGSAKDRQCVSKLLRLWRQRAIFEEGHVLDPIDAFIARVEKGQSSLGSNTSGGMRSPSPTVAGGSPSVGDKRRLPQDPRGRRGPGGLPPPPPPPPPPPHHRRGAGSGAASPRGGGAAEAGPPRTLEFVVAVDREMKALLEQLMGEMGERRPMGIEELARRNPVAAEQLKRAAEAAVVERMVREAEQALAEEAAKNPFTPMPSGPELLTRGEEVAMQLERMIRDPTTGSGGRPGVLAAARETNTQLRAMLNMLLPPEQQQPQPLAPPPPPPPMPPTGLPPHLNQQQQPPAANAAQQLALQALAQQLAGALLQQQQPPGVGVGGLPLPVQPPHAGAAGAGTGTYQQMVARLHAGQQCGADGLRFPDPTSMAAHEAWLDKVRVLAAVGSVGAGGGKKKGGGAAGLLYRAWFSPAGGWCKEQRPYLRVMGFAAQVAKGKGGGMGDEEEGGEEDLAHCVPVDEAHTSCQLCGEPFVQFWDGRSSQWLYRNATEAYVVDGALTRQDGGMSPPSHVREKGGTILVHYLCFQATDAREAAAMLAARGANGAGVGAG